MLDVTKNAPQMAVIHDRATRQKRVRLWKEKRGSEMPDITMCIGGACKVKNTCYRFIAVPNDKWQSYADFTPSLSENGLACLMYIEVKGDRSASVSIQIPHN